jgi:hypothetical protein
MSQYSNYSVLGSKAKLTKSFRRVAISPDGEKVPVEARRPHWIAYDKKVIKAGIVQYIVRGSKPNAVPVWVPVRNEWKGAVCSVKNEWKGTACEIIFARRAGAEAIVSKKDFVVNAKSLIIGNAEAVLKSRRELLIRYHHLVDEQLEGRLSSEQQSELEKIKAQLSAEDASDMKHLRGFYDSFDNSDEIRELRELNKNVRELLSMGRR